MFNLEKALIPKPQQLNNYNKEIKIAQFNSPEFFLELKCDGDIVESGLEFFKEKLYDLALLENFDDSCAKENNYRITVKIDENDVRFSNIAKKEAYYIDVNDNETVVCGIDKAGVLYGLITLSDIAHKVGSNVFLPKCEIIDYPSFERRGHLIECTYGAEFLTREDWFNIVDYFAKMKMNRLTVCLYGCWKIQYDREQEEYLYMNVNKYPFLETRHKIKYYSVLNNKWVYKKDLLPSLFEGDFLGEVIAYGKKKNVEVMPLFNSLGHNSVIPRMIPEVSAKRRNGEEGEIGYRPYEGYSKGFGFCTSNEKTYEVIFNILDEIIDRYIKPNGLDCIHIGLDEVWEQYVCHCEECEKSPHKKLMIDYIIRLCKHLKDKGMKNIYFYYDMLFHEFDIVNEETCQRFKDEGIYDEVVLDWWSYEAPENLFEGKTNKVNGLFRSVSKPFTGCYHFSTPTENNDNVRVMADVALKHNFEGIESYGSFEYSHDKNYLTVADVAWNKNEIENEQDFNERYAYRYYPDSLSGANNALNCIKEVMNKDNDFTNPLIAKMEYYSRIGVLNYYKFPGGAYEAIRNQEDYYLNYFEFLRRNSGYALKFFENNSYKHIMNDVWSICAKHYLAISDEYLTLYDLDKRYNKCEADAFDVIFELDRLILQREELMKLIELTRIPATAYTYLRNMSIYRQYMIDLRDYFKEELTNGRRPRLDIVNLYTYVTSPEFKFLQ